MPVDLKRVKEIFLEAVEKPDPEERAAFLRAACGGEEALRQQVEALLAQHEQAGTFLESPPPGLPQTVESGERDAGFPLTSGGSEVGGERLPEAVGSRIGPYKLLQRLGEGGMGTVYLAEQEEPVKRRVALKVIKAGMDSAHVLARFEQERQALALMDHPNIAKVLDAGTTEGEPGGVSPGRPYFVMELVKGIPITKYCDQEHLTPTERLELFIPVCQAVQHAHHKGIIHRDLKPSNVLIALYDGKPIPKVIDFGVAKAIAQKLTERTMFTEVGQIVGTLEYMAPEQAELNNLDIDTRADIYSLGVILYVLLTGSLPFTAKQLRSAAFAEMLRIIREVEPPRPSTKLSSSEELPSIAANRKLEPKRLTRLVEGELDWIVMKCLEKDRGRRYETANGLARDLERYLADEPVLACPPSAMYKFRKFARRHKTGLAIAGLVLFFLVLLGGGVGWTVRDRASRQAALEQKVANQLALDRERELLLTQFQQLRMGAHSSDWFQGLATKALEMAKVRKDAVLRDQYAASLVGLDARRIKEFKFEASSVVFSKDSNRLLIGGYTNFKGKAQELARVWDGGIDEPRKSKQRGSGPVAFRATDNAALQLVTDPEDWFKVQLWNVDKQQMVREFKLAEKPSPPNWLQRNALTLALSGDGSLVAASIVGLVDGKGTLVVWDVQADNPIRKVDKGFSSLAFSPDGALLAAGDKQGTIKLFSRNQGREPPVLSVGRTEINCLALTRDPLRAVDKEPEDGWLLAVGDAGSGVTIWDLRKKQLRTLCRGSSWNVNAVAFSPDGTMLASTGRHETKLWDATTGQLLLNVVPSPYRNWLTDLAFAPDGKRLAVSSITAFGNSGGVDVWELDYGRGTQTLRGLSKRVTKMTISPDDRLLAALDQDSVDSSPPRGGR